MLQRKYKTEKLQPCCFTLSWGAIIWPVERAENESPFYTPEISAASSSSSSGPSTVPECHLVAKFCPSFFFSLHSFYCTIPFPTDPTVRSTHLRSIISTGLALWKFKLGSGRISTLFLTDIRTKNPRKYP